MLIFTRQDSTGLGVSFFEEAQMQEWMCLWTVKRGETDSDEIGVVQAANREEALALARLRLVKYDDDPSSHLWIPEREVKT